MLAVDWACRAFELRNSTVGVYRNCYMVATLFGVLEKFDMSSMDYIERPINNYTFHIDARVLAGAITILEKMRLYSDSISSFTSPMAQSACL